MAVDYEAVLLDIVDKYLDGAIDFDAFSKAFSTFYYHIVPDDGDWNYAFFSPIIERWEWVSIAPSAEERKDGIVSEDEFRPWLTQHRATHRG